MGKRTLKLNGKGNKYRPIHYSEECDFVQKEYFRTRNGNVSDYLFLNKFGIASVHIAFTRLQRNLRNRQDFSQKDFREYTKTLGFRVSPHTMHHTFAAHLAERDMSQSYIQDLLGHVNINSTRVYTRLMEHARKKKYDQYQ